MVLSYFFLYIYMHEFWEMEMEYILAIEDGSVFEINIYFYTHIYYMYTDILKIIDFRFRIF